MVAGAMTHPANVPLMPRGSPISRVPWAILMLARAGARPYAGIIAMNRRREPLSVAARRDPLGHAPVQARAPGEPLPWAYFLVFLGGALLVAVAMWYFISAQRESVRANWRMQIESIASDRVRLVDSWLNARRSDADVVAVSPPVRALLISADQANEG